MHMKNDKICIYRCERSKNVSDGLELNEFVDENANIVKGH